MRWSSNVLKTSVGEGCAVVTFGRSQPAQDARQPVVAVVLGEPGQSGFSVAKAGEPLTVENFGLEDVPKGFDLAVCPRRADLGAQVPDSKIAEPLTKQSQDPGHPEHERLAVVAHQLQRPTT